MRRTAPPGTNRDEAIRAAVPGAEPPAALPHPPNTVGAMAQNIYDDAAFFEAYAGLRRSQHGLSAAPEWPTVQSLLPELDGARVVDLGCGYGWFCRWAAERGAAAVSGHDLSQRMLDRATELTAGSGHAGLIAYERSDLERLSLPPESADLVYSSLALHYLPDIGALCRAVARALVPGGRFVFTVEHPIATAPTDPQLQTRPDGTEIWPLDRYTDEGARVRDWLAPGVVKYHRTTATYVDALLGAGLDLVRLLDWVPSDEQIAAEPLWAVGRERPTFLVLAARRPDPATSR